MHLCIVNKNSPFAFAYMGRLGNSKNLFVCKKYANKKELQQIKVTTLSFSSRSGETRTHDLLHPMQAR